MHLRTKQTCFKLKAGIQHPGGVSTTPSLNLCHRTGSSRTWYRFWESFHCKKVSLQTPRERALALPEAPSSQLTPPWRTNQCARVCCQHSKWQEEERTQKRTATNTCLDKWLLGGGGTTQRCCIYSVRGECWWRNDARTILWTNQCLRCVQVTFTGAPEEQVPKQ